CEKSLESRRQLLAARENSLANARKQVAEMQDAQTKLETELVALEAELKTVRVAQSRSKLELPEGDLNRIQKSIDGLRQRIQVEQKTLELQAEFANGPVRPDVKPEKKDILKEVDAYFGKTAEKP